MELPAGQQLLSIQAHRGENADAIEDQIVSEKILLERPIAGGDFRPINKAACGG